MTNEIVSNQPAIPKRPRRTGRFILIGVLALVLVAAAVTAIVYRDTLALLLHPERIEINALPETLETLEQLETEGSIRKLSVSESDDRTEILYHSADESVEVNAVYEGDKIQWIEGNVWAMRTSIQTVPDAETFAGKMLSPFFDADEIRAIFLRFTSDIVTQAGRDSMDISLDLAGRYTVRVQGPPMQTVRFRVENKTEAAE